MIRSWIARGAALAVALSFAEAFAQSSDASTSTAEAPVPDAKLGRAMVQVAVGPTFFQGWFHDVSGFWQHTGAGAGIEVELGYRAFSGMTLGGRIETSILPLFETSGDDTYYASQVPRHMGLLTFVGPFVDLDSMDLVPSRSAPPTVHFSAGAGGLMLNHGDERLFGWAAFVGLRRELASTTRLRWGIGAHVVIGNVRSKVDSVIYSDTMIARSEWLAAPALDLTVTYR